MGSPGDSKTSSALLQRLKQVPRDQDAWSELVNRYAPRILEWCVRRGLQDADCNDVCQMVLKRLTVRLPQFDYDHSRSFRGFLRKLTNDALRDAVAARGRLVGAGEEATLALLARQEARDDLIQHLEREFDLELAEAAKRVVRGRVAPHTWEAYRLTAEERLSGAEVAARLGMSIAAVFVAKRSVLQAIKAEIKRLEASE
jgi:RNA polymerase sigma factor (sigma-70 family)